MATPGSWLSLFCAACGTCAARPQSAKVRCGSLLLLLSPFVVFVVLGFWRGFMLHPAVQWSRTAPDPALGAGRHHDGSAGRHVELHGLGQRLHRRAARSRIRSATIPRHDRRRLSHRYHLHSSAGRMALAGLSARQASPPAHGRRGARSAARCSARRRRRRHDQRHWHVQRAGDELHPPAHGHGGRRHAAARLRAAQQPRRSLGLRAVCGFAWALALKLPFERLISIDSFSTAPA